MVYVIQSLNDDIMITILEAVYDRRTMKLFFLWLEINIGNLNEVQNFGKAATHNIQI